MRISIGVLFAHEFLREFRTRRDTVYTCIRKATILIRAVRVSLHVWAELPASVAGFLKARCTRGSVQSRMGVPRVPTADVHPPRYVQPRGTGVVVNRTIRSHATGLPTQRRLVLHALVHTRRRRRRSDLCPPRCRWSKGRLVYAWISLYHRGRTVRIVRYLSFVSFSNVILFWDRLNEISLDDVGRYWSSENHDGLKFIEMEINADDYYCTNLFFALDFRASMILSIRNRQVSSESPD